MIRILSIDGGGIRGILPGQILVKIEEMLQKKTGNTNARIADYFDLFAGTSTGGILVSALLIPDIIGNARPKYSAKEVASFYLEEGPNIFDIPLAHRIRTANGLLDEKYPADGIEHSLKNYFGDLWLSELIKPCIVPAYDIKRRKAHFFTQHDAVKPGNDFYARDVARATSAAPTYFECSMVRSRTDVNYPLIDGGVFANNPTLCAYAEARTLFPKPGVPGKKVTLNDMMILSLGTGQNKELYPYDSAKNWGLAEWVKPVIDIMMSGVSETVDYQMKRMYEAVDAPSQYLRINPQLPPDMSSMMDNAAKENMNALRELGTYCAQEMEKELSFFVDRLIPQDNPPVA